MSEFQVYTTYIPSWPDRVTVITTAFFNPGGYPKCEYFIILPGEEGRWFGCVISFNRASFENCPIKLDEEFMHEEALQQATQWLNIHQNERQQKNPQYPLVTLQLVKEDPEKCLFSLWVRGLCEEQILKISDKTSSPKLQDFIYAITPIQKCSTKPLSMESIS